MVSIMIWYISYANIPSYEFGSLARIISSKRQMLLEISTTIAVSPY